MAVALHILAPSGHGTQCCTALRLAIVPFCDVLHEDRARIALCASNAITSVVTSERIIAVHVVDRGLLTLRQTRETKVDLGGSGSDMVSLEAPRNFGCPRYRCFGASDVQVAHLDHIRPGRKGASKIPFACLDNISEMFLLLWVSTCWTNMMNPMISAEFRFFKVVQSWSSNARAMGPDLWRTRLSEHAVTSVAGTHCPTRTNIQKRQPACQNNRKQHILV